MQNYKMLIQYDGSRYRGWQVQGNTGDTVQGKLERVLSRMTDRPVELHGSGRTDAGVHATGQVASVRLDTSFSEEEILCYVNKNLPQDIAVLSIEKTEDRFHARLNAKWKRYVYSIRMGGIPDVFRRKYEIPMDCTLDLEQMRRGAAFLVGEHDFRSFCGLQRMKKSTVRRIFRIDITQRGNLVELSFVGNGFLFRMVRILAGTLVEVGQGLRSAQSVADTLIARDRAAAGVTLPAQGLCLAEVGYFPYPGSSTEA